MAEKNEGELIDRRSAANMERHVQTILISIITGAIFFAGSYFFTDTDAKATQRTQLATLTTQVIELRADIRAMQNSYVQKADFVELEIRLRRAEERIAVMNASRR